MKTFITGLLKGRTMRWSIWAAVLAAAGLSVAWLGQPCYQLGGAFVGGGGGNVWNALQIPLDPAGKTAAARVHNVTDGPGLAGLLGMFDADTWSEATGQAQMISRDTFKAKWLAYATKAGSPGNSAGIRLIMVMKGTGQFTGPDTMVVDYTFELYLPSADADGDGFPDPGTTPLPIPISGTTSAKRVLP